ncbi:hypothetical protein [Winogradskyella flava]|uniref:Uncharacterized protein n=1 Tax=Winogradskyella flava TaxID=1884876 RepID=A0A842IPQ9_9FLAO|nr:hypothetical protein [Winogradskyella flava]MBC2843497.1 hypothetical protein [Winogradskyella flava]
MKNFRKIGNVLDKVEQKKITGGKKIIWGFQVDSFMCEENGGTWNPEDGTCCFPPQLAGFYDSHC